jgi:hypothetical protein
VKAESQSGVLESSVSADLFSVASTNWFAPGEPPFVQVGDEPSELSHRVQTVPPSEGLALAPFASMSAATSVLVMVTPPVTPVDPADAVPYVQTALGKPSESAVEEPPAQVPKTNEVGLTVTLNIAGATLIVAVLDLELAARAGVAKRPIKTITDASRGARRRQATGRSGD